MDRYDFGEFAGLGMLVAFAGFIWPPAMLLVAGLALLVETQARSNGKAPVRGTQPALRLRRVAKAAAAAWTAERDAAA